MASPKTTAPGWSTEMMTRYGPQEAGNPQSNKSYFDQQAGSPSSQRSSKQGGSADSHDHGEHVEVRGEVCWLQDPNGRLLYMGEASSLSFLEVIRTEIGIAMAGSQAPRLRQFIEDKLRHFIPGARTSRPVKRNVPLSMPEKTIAKALVDSFVTNTCGLIEVLDHTSFHLSLDRYYSDPGSLLDSHLCLIYLVLAIGLVLAIPTHPTQTYDLLSSVIVDPVSCAEMYFQSGKCVAEEDPGYEEGDIWAVQARLLMALYKFLTSKWNASYDYLGSAVSTACSLGFHRIEPRILFDDERVALRRHLWRSIFVLDRLVCEFVDRPTAIRENDFPEDTLRPPLTENGDVHLAALDAVVKSSQAMGQILQTLYTKETSNPLAAQEALNESLERNRSLPESLNCFRFVQERHLGPAEGLAILYVNLLDTHCKLLATRPFFLHTWIGLLHSKHSAKNQPRPVTNVESLSQSCLEASMKAVNMIYNAYRYNWLARRNAFIVNFLFASTMIIMSNELVGMYRNEQYFEAAQNALTMAEAFSGPDAQGQRVCTTLSSYAGFIEEQRSSYVSPQSRMGLAGPSVSPNPISTVGRVSGGASPAAIRTPASEGSCCSGGVPLAPRVSYVESPQSAASSGPGPYSLPPWSVSRTPSDFNPQIHTPSQGVSSAAGSLPYILPAPQGSSGQAVQTRQARQPAGTVFVPYQVKHDQDQGTGS